MKYIIDINFTFPFVLFFSVATRKYLIPYVVHDIGLEQVLSGGVYHCAAQHGGNWPHMTIIFRCKLCKIECALKFSSSFVPVTCQVLLPHVSSSYHSGRHR